VALRCSSDDLLGEASGVNKVSPGGSGRGRRWRPRAPACWGCLARFELTVRLSFLSHEATRAAVGVRGANAVAVGQVTDHDSGNQCSTRTPLSWQHRHPFRD